MNGEFPAALLEWHEFFATMAGVSGTLVGLLFVALGLNPVIMADESPAGLRVWSGLTFHSFIVLLLIGIAGLVPSDDGNELLVTLVILGVQGLVRVGHDVRRVRADPDPNWRSRQALGRFVAPLLAYMICLWLALNIWQQDAGALGWLLAIVFLLTISAASSCWELLKAIGERHRGEVEESRSREDLSRRSEGGGRGSGCGPARDSPDTFRPSPLLVAWPFRTCDPGGVADRKPRSLRWWAERGPVARPVAA